MRRRTLLTGLLAVGGVTALGGSINQPLSPAEAQQLLVRARAAFGHGQYEQAARLLPPLVASGQPATPLLVHAYALASEVATKTNDDDVTWIAADRSLTAAREIGDPLLIAEAARRVAVVLRRAGHPDEATDLLATALDGLPDTPTALRGDLLLTAAYTAAIGGNASDAATLLRAAGDVALRAPRLSTETTFSSQQVLTYGISVCTVLGESGRALHYARQVEPRAQRTPERRARYAVDTAHAWQLHGRHDQAVTALLAAERSAPEELRRASVRSRITAMLSQPGPTPAGLRGLAARAGALA